MFSNEENPLYTHKRFIIALLGVGVFAFIWAVVFVFYIYPGETRKNIEEPQYVSGVQLEVDMIGYTVHFIYLEVWVKINLEETLENSPAVYQVETVGYENDGVVVFKGYRFSLTNGRQITVTEDDLLKSYKRKAFKPHVFHLVQ